MTALWRILVVVFDVYLLFWLATEREVLGSGFLAGFLFAMILYDLFVSAIPRLIKELSQ